MCVSLHRNRPGSNLPGWVSKDSTRSSTSSDRKQAKAPEGTKQQRQRGSQRIEGKQKRPHRRVTDNAQKRPEAQSARPGQPAEGAEEARAKAESRGREGKGTTSRSAQAQRSKGTKSQPCKGKKQWIKGSSMDHICTRVSQRL